MPLSPPGFLPPGVFSLNTLDLSAGLCTVVGRMGHMWRVCRVRVLPDPVTGDPGGHTARMWPASVPEHGRWWGWAPGSVCGGSPCPQEPAITLVSPAGDTGSDAPLTGRTSPREVLPAAEKPLRLLAPPLPNPAPAIAPPSQPTAQNPAPVVPPDRELGAGPILEAGSASEAGLTQGAGLERRGLPGAHARSAAARRVHSRRSFQRPRARRRPALLKLASLQPSFHAPPHALEQEETPL